MHEILAADIGGTSSRFALFRSGAAGLEMLERVSLPTAGAASFAELLDQLAQRGFPAHPDRVDLTVFAVPGPVYAGRCDPPNIAWDMDLERDLRLCAKRTPFSMTNVRMINDFEAQAFAMRSRKRGLVVQAGRAQEDRAMAAMAVIGAGTGLGHCALAPHAGGWSAVPSESGHAAFAFRGAPERDFESFVLARLGVEYCSQEHIVSGSGLALVHEFLTGEGLSPAEVGGRLDRHPRTVRWFARFYGRAARQYVLALMAVGGLSLTGGVAAKNPCLVFDPAFLAEFRNCPEYAKLLDAVPVYLNDDEDSGLAGAALYALQELQTAGLEKRCL